RPHRGPAGTRPRRGPRSADAVDSRTHSARTTPRAEVTNVAPSLRPFRLRRCRAPARHDTAGPGAGAEIRGCAPHPPAEGAAEPLTARGIHDRHGAAGQPVLFEPGLLRSGEEAGEP